MDHLTDSEIISRLNQLRDVSGRSYEQNRLEKTHYLNTAREMSQTVSSGWFSRLTSWMQKNIPIQQASIQEKHTMLNPITTIFLIVTMLFGGGGVTVAAAQSAQPDDLLYPVKIVSEDVRSQLTTNPQSQADLALELTQRRADEIQNQVSDGESLSEETQTRYESEVDTAVQLADGLPEAQAVQALERVQERLRLQQTVLAQLEKNNPHATEMILRSRSMVEQHLEDVQTKLMDPARHAKGDKDAVSPTSVSTETEPASAIATTGETDAESVDATLESTADTRGNGNCAYCSPTKPGNGGNPWILGTPVPGNGPTSACGVNFPSGIRRTDCPQQQNTPHGKPTKKP
jgi:hypothetical protein